MIFRDDDISCFTNLPEFKRAHELFKKYNVMHTVALIMKDLNTHQGLIDYLTSEKNIDLQLHCYEHIDYYKSTETTVFQDLEKAKGLFIELFGCEPKYIFPPWNKHPACLDDAGKVLNLVPSSKKISLQQYIKVRGDVDVEVINFHYWASEEMMFLEQALEIYTKRKKYCI